MKIRITIITVLCSMSLLSQEKDITTSLYDTYEKYKETSITKRRIKHQDIQPLISQYKGKEGYTVKKVGESIEGRSISLISIGTGGTDVFLWSQMHGDEPTATQAIFDILIFFDSDDFKTEKEEILSNLRLHFLPMLNPDGAEVFQRRNTLGIDINRDALQLQSPEGQILKRVRDSLNADFGFNLHDQSTYYNAERTAKPATISYLAPAYNYEKDINEVRSNAMKIIVFMNRIIQKYAPGQVGRYNDDFEPRAFGDNIQKWGTSAILIESGGYANDPEKQEIRKLNYVSILSAIYTISNKSYEAIAIDDYEKIPENDRKLFDLKIENINYPLLGNIYKMDIGIQRPEVDKKKHSDFWYSSRIMDLGDLSTYYGYETFNASGYTIKPGKLYPTKISSLNELTTIDIYSLLEKGYLYVTLNTISKEALASPAPINVVSSTFETPTDLRLNIGVNPTFYLEKNGEIEYVVINGFLINVKDKKGHFSNAMIFR
ncbi:peptidase M14 [Cellulophaga baltica]|uniref:M14 family zinc carboxypeptidase n=1 Tax=Cellulophaga TaxID=104264 RepID=UPI001C06B124|nr:MULTISPECIES: M14 family zinc carboxypeptidase [Cellulophaga]MBU2996243.1 peptidase M14 [Cellulophaga baltica]MDO6767638.1 M14 family zinc carboxypeptidase [Cellulophaga sp. 1_MG-2023]